MNYHLNAWYVEKLSKIQLSPNVSIISAKGEEGLWLTDSHPPGAVLGLIVLVLWEGLWFNYIAFCGSATIPGCIQTLSYLVANRFGNIYNNFKSIGLFRLKLCQVNSTTCDILNYTWYIPMNLRKLEIAVQSYTRLVVPKLVINFSQCR